MRTTVQKVQVEVEVKTYQCDHCDFESKEASQVRLHNAETHLVLGERLNGGDTLYEFDTKEAATQWLDAVYPQPGYMVHEVYWAEPGWYQVRMWRQRCPKGCCMDDCVRLEVAGTPDEEEEDD